jgi:hypothetical protein
MARIRLRSHSLEILRADPRLRSTTDLRLVSSGNRAASAAIMCFALGGQIKNRQPSRSHGLSLSLLPMRLAYSSACLIAERSHAFRVLRRPWEKMKPVGSRAMYAHRLGWRSCASASSSVMLLKYAAVRRGGCMQDPTTKRDRQTSSLRWRSLQRLETPQPPSPAALQAHSPSASGYWLLLE